MKTLTRTSDAARLPTGAKHPWRATGHESPVFADPSGRRALTMGGLGLTMAAITVTALAIVVTAAFGFTTVPTLRLPASLGTRPSLIAHHADRRVDRNRFAALGHLRGSAEPTAADAASDRRTHV